MGYKFEKPNFQSHIRLDQQLDFGHAGTCHCLDGLENTFSTET